MYQSTMPIKALLQNDFLNASLQQKSDKRTRDSKIMLTSAKNKKTFKLLIQCCKDVGFTLQVLKETIFWSREAMVLALLA